jgi:hypothetical protein
MLLSSQMSIAMCFLWSICVFCLVNFMQEIEWSNFHYTYMRLVHYVFHKILSELGKNYHGENGQPFHE